MFSKMLFVTLCVFVSHCFAEAIEGLHPAYVWVRIQPDTFFSRPTPPIECGGLVADGKRKLVVVAWHCIPNQPWRIAQPGVVTINDHNAKFLAYDSYTDLVVFHVPDLGDIEAPSFSTPKKGDVLKATALYDAFPVMYTGEPNDREKPALSIRTTLDWEGKVATVGYASERFKNDMRTLKITDSMWIVATGSITPGFSGGPAFDTSGNCVGLVSSFRGTFTNISSSENIVAILKKIP